MPLYELDGRRPTLPEDGSAWIAPSADVIGDARLGAQVSVWFGAVIRADNSPITVGDRTNLQDGATLHSDEGVPCTIGADCTVGHRAILHGCTIGDNVLVGMNATVLNHAVIGDGCVIGANALVTEGKEFPPGSMIVGAPARAIRTLPPEWRDRIAANATGYAAKQRDYASGLKRIDG